MISVYSSSFSCNRNFVAKGSAAMCVAASIHKSFYQSVGEGEGVANIHVIKHFINFHFMNFHYQLLAKTYRSILEFKKTCKTSLTPFVDVLSVTGNGICGYVAFKIARAGNLVQICMHFCTTHE